MPNTSQIGNAFVKKIREKALEPNGFRVQTAGKHVVWIPERRFDPRAGKAVPVFENGKMKLRPITRQEDFFGCLDLIALHQSLHPCTHFIQATVGGDRARQERQKKIVDAACWNIEFQKVHIWQRDDKDKQQVWIYELISTANPSIPNVMRWVKFGFHFKKDKLFDVLEHSKQEA